MRKLTLAVCGVALAAVTLTACNSDKSAAPTTGGASSAAPEAKGTGAFDSLKALSDAVTEESSSAKSAHFTMKAEVAGQSIDGEGDFAFGAETAMQMKMSTPQGSIEMRFVDNVIYMKMPQELTPGKPWLKIDLADKDNPMAKMMAESMSTTKSTDPREMLKELAKVGEIKSVEDDKIDGKDTKHYKIVVETSKLKNAELGMDKSSVAALEKSGVKEMPVDVWIGEDNLPVRFVMDIPAEAGAKGKVQADYTDWGKGVTVEAPPAAEIGEFPGA